MYILLKNLYSFMTTVILPFILLLKLIKKSLSVQRLKDLLGRTSLKLDRSIWFHCVSVGETIALKPLLLAITKEKPETSIVVTNTTINGRKIAEKIFISQKNINFCFFPFDLETFFYSFIKRINPIICILLEKEIWPNLLFICRKFSVPVILNNGILSERSFRRYRCIIYFTKFMINQINYIAVQTLKDKENFLSLGFKKNNIVITGNIKHHIQIERKTILRINLIKKNLQNSFIWIAASINREEEDIILQVHKKLKDRFPKSSLIIAPRNIKRCKSINTIIYNKYRFTSTSDVRGLTEVDVYVHSYIGDMLTLYGVSDISFIGKSIFPQKSGGHNPLEPASLKKPILTGPNFCNFRKIFEDLKIKNGVKIVNNAEKMFSEITYLVQNKNYRNILGENAYKYFLDNQGALQKQLKIIKKFL